MASFDLPLMVAASSEETAEVEKELQMSDIEGSPSSCVFTSYKRSIIVHGRAICTSVWGFQTIEFNKKRYKWGVKLFLRMYLAY